MMRPRTVNKALVAAVFVACALILFYTAHHAFNNQDSQKLSPSQDINLMETQQRIRVLPEKKDDSVQVDSKDENPVRIDKEKEAANIRVDSIERPVRIDMEKEPNVQVDDPKENPESIDKEKEAKIDRLGQLFTRDAKDWSPLNCDRSRKLRPISFQTRIGNLTIYVYDSVKADTTITVRALRGNIFERTEIETFLKMTKDLPLIDIGANVGLVTLQAAMQGRQVVAVEPIPENALRLCRAAVDFGYGPLVHVINNAVSSSEGNVTLASPQGNQSTLFEVAKSPGWGKTPVVKFAILLDRLLEVVPFRRSALKIDVESHEGHVISGAHRLFQEMDIPFVWMEWEHVKRKKEYGGRLIVEFMRKYDMEPFSLMQRKRLDDANFILWPFTVLWKKKGVPMPA